MARADERPEERELGDEMTGTPTNEQSTRTLPTITKPPGLWSGQIHRTNLSLEGNGEEQK